jgi:HEAT repeat protein
MCALSTLLPEAIPVVAHAYANEPNWKQRELLIHVLWQLRDPAAIPTLVAALEDSSDRVWKEALDGLVILGPPSLGVLAAVRDVQPASSVLRPWLEEAIEQIVEDAKSQDSSG